MLLPFQGERTITYSSPRALPWARRRLPFQGVDDTYLRIDISSRYYAFALSGRKGHYVFITLWNRNYSGRFLPEKNQFDWELIVG